MIPNNNFPTMKDVAKLARVSQPTVSYVINGTANISPEVSARVHAAIKKLKYQPNVYAQNLKSKTTKTIGLLLPDISNTYYATIAAGVEKQLRKEGYVIFLACSNHKPDIEELYINNFIRYNVAGIIITYSLADISLYGAIRSHSIPLVILDSNSADPTIPEVQVCNEEGGRLATQYLIDLGYRKIALASEPLEKFPLILRINGYKIALENNQISFSDDRVFIAEDQSYDIFSMGYQIGDLIIHSNVDSVFATSDQLAFGIIKKLKENNVRIPNDIALIGYDDVFTSRIISPALTTVSQQMEQTAIKGVSLLINIINGVTQDIHVLLTPSLVIRETTCLKSN